MLTLPPAFAAIAKAAAREPTRYALNGVYVEEANQGRTSRAVATDGHLLALMEAPNEAAEFPPVFPEGTPNGRTWAVIPADTFAGAFKKVPKGRLTQARPVLANLLVQPSDKVTTLGSTDLAGQSIEVCPNPELTFPPYKDLLPNTTPVFRYAVNPAQLMTLLQMAKGLAPEGHPCVVLEFFRQERPMVLRAAAGDSTFIGLLMPVNLDGPLANDENYRQWDRKVQAVDKAFAAVQALQRYLGTRQEKLAPDLQALQELCQKALAAAGLTEARGAAQPATRREGAQSPTGCGERSKK